MPFPNHFAIRVQDPDRFDKESYRTTAGGKIFGGRVVVPGTVNILWAKIKGKAKPSDPPVLQSLRFNKANWDEDRIRKWLKDNNVKFILFEKPSEPKKEEETEEAVYIKIPVPVATDEEREFFEEHGICDLAEETPTGKCVCPKCLTEVSEKVGIPCHRRKCPEDGAMMEKK